ncbi:MAG: hypothetical protein RL226_792 [Bacteroidota bacterium]|jgi:DnaJ like chaperone protein
MGYGKWIGGALGWAFGGPIGAAMGFAMGMMFDDNTLSQEGAQTRDYKEAYRKQRHHTTGGDFAVSLIILSAEVMKADGKIMRSELDYVKQFFDRNFGKAASAQYVDLLQQMLKQQNDVRAVAEQVRYFMDHPQRLLMLQYLFGIALADGQVDNTELNLIDRIAGYLGISDKDFTSIKATFYTDTKSHYEVLEIAQDADDGEVKKAYRKMANKYHPDKVRELGDDYQKMAQEKFIRVQQAYEAIKKERGLK